MVSCHRGDVLLGETDHDAIPQETTKSRSFLIDRKVAAKDDTNAELYH